MIITLTGEPQSTNHIYKVHCKFGYPTVYMTAAGKALKEDYQWQAKSQWKHPIIQKDDVYITIKLFFGRKGKHDIDNYGKLLLDALTGIVWEDDSQVIKMTVIKWYDKDNPRIEIDII